MDVPVLLTRALSGIGKQTIYDSPGKMPPFAGATWPAGARNDCSGYVSWCMRFSESRRVNHPLYVSVNGGWFETTAIYRDGLASTGFFRQQEVPEPGSLLVYPDYLGSDGKMHDGHVGIVVESSAPGIAGATKVVHCSLGNYRATGDAIQLTDSSPWMQHSNAIIVWLEGLDA